MSYSEEKNDLSFREAVVTKKECGRTLIYERFEMKRSSTSLSEAN